MAKWTGRLFSRNGATHVLIGKREHGGKPFTEYDGPEGSKVRVWSPSVSQEAHRRADLAIDRALASIRDDEKRYGS